MKQTSKYQLNLIENSDRFLAEPINENMQAIEDALISHNVDSNAHSALQTATGNHIADKNNPHGVTAAQVGAAASSHNHSASNITSGTLPTARGGTGNTSVDTTPTSGSTKMVTSGGIYTALAGKSDTSHTHSAYAAASHTHSTYAASSHNHAAGNITSGTLPVARGGTGNTSVDTTPTSGSKKMVTSGGVYTALASKFDASNLPWVIGTYTGTGEIEVAQTISLGFQPSAVFVTASTDGNFGFGMALRSGSTVGVLCTTTHLSGDAAAVTTKYFNITSNGFSVVRHESNDYRSLNESGRVYVYFAIK